MLQLLLTLQNKITYYGYENWLRKRMEEAVTELALTLMRRDGLSEAEALEMEQEAREAIQEALMNGDDPEEVLMDMCGLEPDYIMELLEY